MEKFIIEGANKLEGKIEVQGSKNASLPIIIATVLTNGQTILKNCPKLVDTENACAILELMGCKTSMQQNTLIIDSKSAHNVNISKKLMAMTRSSIIFLGAMLSKFGYAEVFSPGGCAIGKRPIDMHIAAIEKMGVEIKKTEEDKLICKVKGKRIKGATIFLNYPSVGATENIIMAAVLAKGTTKIVNAAAEPEIENFCCFLKKCGAKIKGAGTQCITIEGVEKLNSCEFRIMSDRIVAATLLIAGAIASGNIELKLDCQNDLAFIIEILRKTGCVVKTGKNRIFLKSNGNLKAIEKIITTPYPGFPTDVQPILMALACICQGTSVFIETIFENRFRHVNQLRKFGAKIEINGRAAIINGVKKLEEAEVVAEDLRGGAALVAAALAAKGRSTIYGINYIDRGYEKIEEQLLKLGANIKREEIRLLLI